MVTISTTTPLAALYLERAASSANERAAALGRVLEARDAVHHRGLAAYLAHKSRLVYKDADTIRGVVAAEGAEATIIERGWSRALLYRIAGHACLVFRGTFKTSQFLAIDLNALPTGWPLRHYGFLYSWLRIRADVANWTRSLPEEMPLLISGHSLGGAMALVAAYDLAAERRIRAVVTFGAPRAGLFHFQHRYERTLERSGSTLRHVTVRYTHRTDLVSRVPPPFPYCHVGEEYHLDDDGSVTAGRPPDVVERALTWWDALQARKSMTPQSAFVSSPEKGVANATRQPGETVRPLAMHHPALIPGLAPWWSLSPEQRRVAAWNRLMGHSGSVLAIISALPIMVLWMLGATVGIALARVAWIDLGEHDCVKYMRALGRREPLLAGDDANLEAIRYRGMALLRRTLERIRTTDR